MIAQKPRTLLMLVLPNSGSARLDVSVRGRTIWMNTKLETMPTTIGNSAIRNDGMSSSVDACFFSSAMSKPRFVPARA